MSTNMSPGPQQPPRSSQGEPPVARPAGRPPQRHRLQLWQWVYIGAGAVILVAIIVTALNRETQPPAAASNTGPKQWATVEHFTGSQSMQTYIFHVAAGNRIAWIATPTSSTNSFTVSMSKSDGSVSTQVARAANISNAISQTYTVHGDYEVYLTIAAEATSYDISVQASK